MRLIAVALLVIASQAPVAQDRDGDIERIAMQGWMEARALAPRGGALDLLGPVNAKLKQLDEFPNTSARYAEMAIRAAVAAAQEERDEMSLFLDQARDLSKQMAVAGSPARWPLPIDELEGELWLEVDRYLEAFDAYDRATKTTPTPNAWIGLARAADKLHDTATACRAYLAVKGTQGLPTSVDLEVSMYLLKCSF